jgi:hypothetical protein
MEQKPLKIRPSLLSLEVGETIAFPLCRLKSVRTQASELGLIYRRTFCTRTDRDREIVIVLRVN